LIAQAFFGKQASPCGLLMTTILFPQFDRYLLTTLIIWVTGDLERVQFVTRMHRGRWGFETERKDIETECLLGDMDTPRNMVPYQ
jgi:hypothetical protein